MALDTRYVPSSIFQEYFVDKDTGAPLAAGVVTFYKDQARTVKKDIFELSGSPPNYSYPALPNPITLSAVGTIQNGSGQDIIPYFYPYDSSGNVELYYITVESSGAVSQFTREGKPNTSGIIDDGEDLYNYILNGQFLEHRTDPNDSMPDEWTTLDFSSFYYYRPSGSTAVDTVEFDRFGSSTSNPTSNPRYACRFKCVTPDPGDANKWVGYIFRDVNKFTSYTTPKQLYTFYFEGLSNTGSQVQVNVRLRKFYGVGGSAGEFIDVVTINLGTSWSSYQYTFDFGDNLGKTIGPDDDDEVAIVLDFPADVAFDASVTNFVLVKGDVELAKYPVRTDEEYTKDVFRRLVNDKVNPDGSDLYLPVILTNDGIDFDDSTVGFIYPATREITDSNYLPCDGSAYDRFEHSSLGIPYSRLADKLWVAAWNINVFGTKDTFIICRSYVANQFILESIQFGLTTTPTDGTTPTGFTIAVTAPGSATTIAKFTFTTVAGSLIPAGAYFNFYAPNADHYVLWYEVNGLGTAPTVPGATLIKASILSTDLDSSVMIKSLDAINQKYVRVPDFRGAFLRGWDNGRGLDPDVAVRIANQHYIGGDVIGSFQPDGDGHHTHPFYYGTGSLIETTQQYTYNDGVVSGFSTNAPIDTDTGYSAGNESRPKNYYVNYVIKY